AAPESYPLSLHDALPISFAQMVGVLFGGFGVIGLHDYTSPLRLYGWFSVLVLVMLHRLWAIRRYARTGNYDTPDVEAMRRRFTRSEEHTSELQSRENLVC